MLPLPIVIRPAISPRGKARRSPTGSTCRCLVAAACGDPAGAGAPRLSHCAAGCHSQRPRPPLVHGQLQDRSDQAAPELSRRPVLPGAPILRPDRPWEREGSSPTALVFSDGVWYDSRDRQFKMWYVGGAGRSVCYATSKDGIRWESPRSMCGCAPTSSSPVSGTRPRSGWIRRRRCQPAASSCSARLAWGITSVARSTSRRTAFTGVSRRSKSASVATARPSSGTRSARC
jgi:hypothetical protein